MNANTIASTRIHTHAHAQKHTLCSPVRLNWHIAELAAQRGGAIIVDATRNTHKGGFPVRARARVCVCVCVCVCACLCACVWGGGRGEWKYERVEV